MARYHGGKQLSGRRISSYMLDFVSSDGSYDGYCEPFCGMLGVYRHMYPALDSNETKFLAGDINASVIAMWQKAQTGWIPPSTCTEEEFMKMKYDGLVTAEKGFLGHQLSFGGVYFASYVGRYNGNINCKSAALRVHELAFAMPNINFECKDYKQYACLENYIIYCDPPYKNTVQQYRSEFREGIVFEHDTFWQWVREMSCKNMVFVSEYQAPSDFVNIADEFSLRTIKGKKTTSSEKLFVFEPLFQKSVRSCTSQCAR